MKIKLPLLFLFATVFSYFTPVHAEFGSGGALETGLYGGYEFPNKYLGVNPKNAFLGGARLGYWFTSWISFEGSFQRAFSKTATDQTFHIDSTQFNVLVHLLSGQRFRPFLTAGGGWDRAPGNS